MSRSLCGVFALTLLSACTQVPAPIDNRGTKNFGRAGTVESNIVQASTAPAYGTIQSMPKAQNAHYDSVGVSDLAPPTAQKAKPTVVAANKTAPDNHINPWTNRAHFDNQPVASAAAPAAAASVQTAQATKPLAHEQSAFIWPVNGQKIISGFGPKNNGKVNDGITIAAGQGEPVWASADGEVLYVGQGTGDSLQGYGNMIIIKHAGNKTTSYAHLSSSSVEKYDRVKQGDIIGYVGSTGDAKQPELQFALRNGKDPVDPAKYLSRSVAGL